MFQVGDRVTVYQTDIKGHRVPVYKTSYGTYTTFLGNDGLYCGGIQAKVSRIDNDYAPNEILYWVKYDLPKECGMIELTGGCYSAKDMEASHD